MVAAAKRGEAGAFDSLVAAHCSKAFRTACCITRNREDAEDAVQDSLLRAFVHIHEFDGRSSFSTWLTTIVINSSLMIIRRRRRIREVSAEEVPEIMENAQPLDQSTQSPERQCQRQEQRTILRRAIKSLRLPYRQILEQQLQENSMAQAAETIGITVIAAKARLFQAKAALGRAIEKCGNVA